MDLRPHALTDRDVGEAAPRPPRPAVAELAAVTKVRYGELVLDRVSVSVPGGVTAVVGGNGAGKSTFLALVAGDLSPDRGSVERRWRKVGVVDERPDLPRDVTAAELVRHVAEVHGLRRAVARRRAQEALDDVGLAEERLRPVGSLSLGVQRRVALALALVHQPDLLVLDEPTNGLDRTERRRFLALLSTLAAQDVDVVVAAHDRADLGGVETSTLLVAQGDVVPGAGVARRRLAVTCRGPVAAAVRELRAAGLRPRVDGAVIRLPNTARARDALHLALLRTATPVSAIDVEAVAG